MPRPSVTWTNIAAGRRMRRPYEEHSPHSERQRWGASVPAASTGEGTGFNFENPIPLDGFVRRKIHCNCYRRRPPCELLSELEVGSDFFEPRENDLEGSCGVRGAAGCIDGHNGSPFSLQR